jgi:hypothetical protein
MSISRAMLRFSDDWGEGESGVTDFLIDLVHFSPVGRVNAAEWHET